MAGSDVIPAQRPDDIITGLTAIRNRHNLVSIHPDRGPQQGYYCDLSNAMEHDFVLRWIAKQQDNGCNVYFHANPVRAGFQGIKAGLGDIEECTHAQFDMDPDADNTVPFEDRRRMVKQRMRFLERSNPPSIIIDSGNGFNILWELESPVPVEDYQILNKNFNEALSPREGTFNADRILKVPGTIAYNGAKKVQDKGYPAVSQARLVKVSDVKTTFVALPSQASAASKPSSTKDTMIPVPTNISQGKQDALRDCIRQDKALQTALKPGNYPDQSKGLEAIAGAARRAGLSELDFASIVVLADKSDGHQHLMKQNPGYEQERALGRAWDDVARVPGAKEFEPVTDPAAVPVKKPSIDEIIGSALPDQGDLLGRAFPVKRAYVEQWTMEGVRLFGGAQKSGKSWLFLQEAQAVGEGRADFLGLKVHRGRVLYVGLEDGDRRLADRLRGLQVKPCQDIKYWQENWTQDSGAGNLEVLENIHTKFPFDVVYIDTLKFWFGNSVARFGTAYDQSVEDMKPLVKFCQKKHVALNFTTHLRKEKRGIDDWQDLFQGSLGLASTVDTLTMLNRKRGSDDAILHRSGRDLDDDDDLAVEWAGMPNGWELSSLSANAIAAANRTRSGSMKAQIIDQLKKAGGSMSKVDLRLHVTGSKTQFYDALRGLDGEGTVCERDDNVFLI